MVTDEVETRVIHELDLERDYIKDRRKISAQSEAVMAKLTDRFSKKDIFAVVLVFVNALYLYIGGVIFQAIEWQPIPKYSTSLQVIKLLEALKKTEAGNQSLPANFNATEAVQNLTSEELQRLDSKLNRILETKSASEKGDWDFLNSVFFASTIVTTIGYGNLSPVTFGGRAFCVIYSFIGIPLTLILLAVVGKVIADYVNNACAWIVINIKKYLYPEYEFEAASGEINAPIWLTLSILMLVICLMASLFCGLEGWSFGVSLYFLFITLTTIGFGDIVPHNKAVVLINTTLLYVGLAVVSITINLCIVSISRQMRKTQKHFKHFKMAEELSEEKKAEEEQQTTSTSKTSGDIEQQAPVKRVSIEDDSSAQSLRITQTAEGKYYGSVGKEQEMQQY